MYKAIQIKLLVSHYRAGHMNVVAREKNLFFFGHVITILTNHNHEKNKIFLHPVTRTKILLNWPIIF